MEKLMSHLKVEATQKLKLSESLRISEKTAVKLREKIDLMAKKSHAKDRLVIELREGSKILEDQLRLMDEKYLELRTKLDYARENGAKKVQQAEKVSKELRMKFALAGNSSMLDKVPLPSIFTNGSIAQQSTEEFMASFDMYASNVMSGSMVSGAHTTGSISSGKRNLKKKSNNNRPSMKIQGLGVENESDREITVDHLLDKIRRNRGAKKEWTDDSLRALTKSN